MLDLYSFLLYNLICKGRIAPVSWNAVRKVIAMERFRVMLCTVLATALMLTLSSVVFAAGNTEGEVLYHQSFSDISAPEYAGIRKGLSGADGFSLEIADKLLVVNNYNDIKAYAIFPSVSSDDDYTIVYSFKFTEIFKQNGYVGFMLTCSGDEPSNITSALIRADGNCGDFGELGGELSEHISAGDLITVTIPVEQNTLHEMKVSCGEISETLILENVVDISKGNFGFVVRNASVGIESIYIVNGVGYVRMTGNLAVKSTWSDDAPYSESFSVDTYSASIDARNDTAPQTADALGFEVLLCGASLIAASLIVVSLRKRNH